MNILTGIGVGLGVGLGVGFGYTMISNKIRKETFDFSQL